MFGKLFLKTNAPNREKSSRSKSSQTKLLTFLKEKNVNAFSNVLTSGLQSNQVDINYHYAHGTLLHFACRTKKNHKFVEILLEHGADINVPNAKQSHKTAIHLAVENNNLEALQILLGHADCDVNSLTSYGETALHCAVQYSTESRAIWLPNHPSTEAFRINQSDESLAQSQPMEGAEMAELDPENVKLLLRHPDIDVNILNRNHRTPLHLAIHLGRRKVIHELLKHPDIDLDTFKDFKGYTCRQLLTSAYPEFAERISQITPRNRKATESLFSLLRQRDLDAIRDRVRHFKPNSKQHDGKYTYLQYACNHGLVQIVEILLKAGVDPNQYCPNNPLTPLMIAAQRGNHKILQILLGHSAISFEPVGRKTVLHTLLDGMFAIKSKQVKNHPEWDHLKCLECLLKVEYLCKLDIHFADPDGNTALHYAVKLNNETAVKALLRAGAHFSRKNLQGKVPLTSISASALEDCLDNCVSTNGKHSREDDYEIIFDYSIFARPKTKESEADETIKDYITEMDALLLMNETPELRKLLKHPVLLSFLNLKWHTIAKYFYINLMVYFIFCIFLTTYICNTNNWTNNTQSANNLSTDTGVDKELPNIAIYFKYLTSILCAMLLLRELYQFYISPCSYFKFAENWLELTLIGMTITLLIEQISFEQRRQLSSATIMASWMELMLLIGKHPLSSTNIEMFKTVSYNFLKFLAWYSILLVAFSLSFYILFKDDTNDANDANNTNNKFFKNPALSFIKSIIMLTGEFDAGSMPLFPFNLKFCTSYVLFVSFVFLVAIVLLNLLSGLAVSDIQTIRADAKLVGVVSRVKLIAYVEAVTIGANLLPYYFLENKIRVLPNNHNTVFVNNSPPNPKKDRFWETTEITRYNFQIDPRIMREAVKILNKNNRGKKAAVGECILQRFDEYDSRVENVEKLLESVDKYLKHIMDILKSK